MRFLMMVKVPAGNDYESGGLPSPELVAAMTKFNEEMAQAGVILAAEGLHPTSQGVRVEVVNGRRIVTDGPFTEAKEVFGGYWVIQVASKEEAVAWATRVPDEEAIIELRRIFDMEDFPQEIQAAADSPLLRDHLESVASA